MPPTKAILLAAIVATVAGCAKPEAAPAQAGPEPAPPEPAFVSVPVKFQDCVGWLFNQEMPFEKARALVAPAFTPERAGAGQPFPPGSAHDPNAGRKIFWALTCGQATVGNDTFQNAGYLYACIPSIPDAGEWRGAYSRHYLAIELGVAPPAFAKAINAQTGLHVTPGQITTGPANAAGNGVHEWRFRADNWSFVLARRAQEPTPAVYRYDTAGVTSLWTTHGDDATRASRHSHGGYGNVRYPTEARFEGDTPAKSMFEPGETVWAISSVAFTGELGGARDSWTPEARYRMVP